MNPRHFFSALLLLVGSEAFSQVGPDYQRPQTDTPERYKGVVMRQARPLDAIGKGAWWTVFGDRRLNALMEDTVAHSQDLKAAIARFDQARATARLDRGDFWPSIGAGFVGENQRTSSNMPSAFPLNGMKYQGPGYTVPLEFSWELDLWGKLRRQSEASVADAQAAAAAMHHALLSLQAELAMNYFQLRTLDSEIAVVQDAIGLRRESMQITDARVKAGSGNELELAQVKTELSASEAEVSALKTQRDQLENAIAVIAGQNPSVFRLPTVQTGLGLPPSIPSGIPSDLLERRPDIAQAERTLAAASARIGVTAAAIYPSLSLVANGGWLSGDLGTLLDSNSLMWNAGARLAGPIFSGGKLRASKKRSMAAFDEALAGYRRTILVAFAEVENSLSAINNLKEQAAAQSMAGENAQRALDLAKTRYDSGSSPYLEVIDTDRTALTIRRGNVQVRGQQWLAAVSLIKAIGGGWNAKEEVAIPVTQPDPESKIHPAEEGKEKRGFFGKIKGVFTRDKDKTESANEPAASPAK